MKSVLGSRKRQTNVSTGSEETDSDWPIFIAAYVYTHADIFIYGFPLCNKILTTSVYFVHYFQHLVLCLTQFLLKKKKLNDCADRSNIIEY